MTESLRSPSLTDVVDKSVEQHLQDARFCTVARVESYDAEKQQVDVAPLLRETVVDAEGREVVHQLPVIVNVPVAFPGAGGFRITFPVAAGDTVVLVHSDRSLDEWLTRGGMVTPLDIRQHDLSDAIAIPSIRPGSAPYAGASTSNMTAGKDGGPQIHFTATSISLGEESPVDTVAMTAKVAAALAALKTAISSATVAGGDGGAAFKLSLVSALASWPASLGSTTVKVSD